MRIQKLLQLAPAQPGQGCFISILGLLFCPNRSACHEALVERQFHRIQRFDIVCIGLFLLHRAKGRPGHAKNAAPCNQAHQKELIAPAGEVALQAGYGQYLADPLPRQLLRPQRQGNNVLVSGRNHLAFWPHITAAMALARATGRARAALGLPKGIGQALFNKALACQDGICPGKVDIAKGVAAHFNGLLYAVAPVACVERAQHLHLGPGAVCYNNLNPANAFVAVLYL